MSKVTVIMRFKSKQTRSLLVVSFFAIFTFGCASNTSIETKVASPYQAELLIVKDRSKNADFEKLRMTYTNTAEYSPYGGNSFKGLFNALNEKDFKKCIALSKKLLEKEFPSLSGHYAAMVCNTELENNDDAIFHKFVLNGLMDSIGNSGDGKSEGTAFITISTDELRAFLQLAGMQIEGQALVKRDGRSYDVMTVKDSRNGTELELYFDISIQMDKGMKFAR